MSQFRRPTKDAKRRPHEFSRIIVCSACRRPLRVMLPKGIPYYKDTSKVRKSIVLTRNPSPYEHRSPFISLGIFSEASSYPLPGVRQLQSVARWR